jgi:RNA polymerase sigma factor (sigma-70 family)
MEHLRGSARPAAAEPTDGELLERFVTRREEGAFAELIHRHGPMVLSVCRRVLDSAEDVEDAFQATFMILVRKADSIRKRESAASWLYGVALRVARRARTALTRRRDRERQAAVSETAATPEEAWRDLRPVLDDAVDALPEKYRVLIVLCYLQGRTYDEAARLLDLAKGTVSTRLTQARMLLKRHLTRRGVVLPLALLATLLERNAAPAAVPPQLPPLAVTAGRSAAGMGGTVSARVETLSQTSLRSGSVLAPVMVAVLAGLLALMTGGLVAYRTFGPPRAGAAGEDETQAWTERFSQKDQPMVAYSFRFSPDGKWWAWQAGDGQIRVADTATGQNQVRIMPEFDPAHPSYANCLGFTSDNKEVVTAATDIRVWDVATQKETARYPGGLTTAWGSAGKTLATVSADGAIHVIDLLERRERVVPERLPGPVRALAFSPDGTKVASSGSDGAVVIYDAETSQRQRRLTGNAMPTLELAFSPDGSNLAALHGNPDAGAATTNRAVQIWQLDAEQKIELAPSQTIALAYAPHSGTLVTQELNGEMSMWNPATGDRKHFFGGGGTLGARLLRIVFSPDGKTVVVGGSKGSALLRTVATGRVVATLGHAGPVADAAFSPDGRMLATGTLGSSSADRRTNGLAEVKLWDRVR